MYGSKEVYTGHVLLNGTAAVGEGHDNHSFMSIRPSTVYKSYGESDYCKILCFHSLLKLGFRALLDSIYIDLERGVVLMWNFS